MSDSNRAAVPGDAGAANDATMTGAATTPTAAAAGPSGAGSAPSAAPSAAAASALPALAPQSALLHKSPAIKALAPLPPSSATSAAQSASTAADSQGAAALAATAGAAPPSLTLADDDAPAAGSGSGSASASAPSASSDSDSSSQSAPRPEHLLHQPWTFWYDVSDGKPKEWGASLRKLIEINSVETFWGMMNNIAKPSTLPVKSDYHMFRYGIKPEWEDPQNRGGGKSEPHPRSSHAGHETQTDRHRSEPPDDFQATNGFRRLCMARWVWEMKRDEGLDQGWLNTLLALIGEHFTDEHEVLGTVISLRKGRNRLALWTRSSQDRSLALRVGAEWRKMLPMSNAVKLGFVPHSQTMKGSKTSYDMQPAYTV